MPGPFYFAWVNPADNVWNPAFAREDEEVFAFEISHTEGDFPTLTIEIKNPRRGYLAPDAYQWAWLAWDRNEQDPENPDPSIEPDIVPLFFGRIVGMPEDLANETVQLTFLARPLDFQDQKIIVANGLKQAPYWDPIWFNPDSRDDPDNVLESRPQLWHIDRVSLAVTVSHILNGEDGLLTLGEDDIFYDSVTVSYGSAPLRRVDVVASVSWPQQAKGVVSFTPILNYGAPNGIATFTPHGLIDNWPKVGTNVGGGWSVAAASVRAAWGIAPVVWGYSSWGLNGIPSDDIIPVIVPEWMDVQTILNTTFPAHVLNVTRAYLFGQLTLAYDVTRNYSEQLAFSLQADVQSVISDPGEEDVELLTFSSAELTSPIDPARDESSGPEMPIRDLRSPTFFSTDRGEESIQYLIALARARLLLRSRCVEIGVECSFEKGVDMNLSLRKSLYFEDYRLPGGNAAGKIIEYKLAMNGDDGTRSCAITIGATVGRGNTVAPDPGEPTYCDDDYVEDYQHYDSKLEMPIAGEVLYQSINGLPPNDDGFDFRRLKLENVILPREFSGHWEQQKAALGERGPDPQTVFKRVNDVPTVLKLNIKSLTGGPFQTNYDLLVSTLMVPKTIDLEAEGVS